MAPQSDYQVADYRELDSGPFAGGTQWQARARYNKDITINEVLVTAYWASWPACWLEVQMQVLGYMWDPE